MTLADLLFGSEAEADDVLVTADGRTATRTDLERQAETVALALREAGVAAGNAVAVSMPNGAPLVAVLFGVWRIGAVHLPVNPRLTPAEQARILDAVRPAAVVTPAGEDAWTVAPRADAIAYASSVALIQLTSGTTGPPTPVPLEHEQVLGLLDGVIASLRSGRGRNRDPMPNLVPVSLSLWAGIYQVLFAFRAGAPVVLMDRFDPVELARLVAEHGIRSVVLPPAAMAMLVDEPAVTSLAPLRYVRSITAPLSPYQAGRFMNRFGIAVMNSYGQTELGGEIVGWTAADARDFTATKLGAVGRPHPGVEVRAVGDGGVALGTDEVGEIVVRTETIRRGGLDPAFAARCTDDGWFRTGDVGRVDADGFVWVEGRVSDMINRGGLKVTPAEVEEVLRCVPPVADAAVVGVPDDRLGEVPWAFVVLTPGAALDPYALASTCREHLAPYKVPVEFREVDRLPRNEVGKVLARDLLEQIKTTRSEEPT